VALFRATKGVGADEPFVNLFADSLPGWARHVAGEVKIVEVVGGRTSMPQEPRVENLAERLSAALEEHPLVVEAAA
jgi:hypothetical protein